MVHIIYSVTFYEHQYFIPVITSQNNKAKIIVELKRDIGSFKVMVIVSPTVYGFHDPRGELV